MNEFTNKEIARILSELADLLEITGENRFKVIAYQNAARKIMDINTSIEILVKENRLKEISGIGKGIATTIKEIFDLGYSPLLEEIKEELPAGVLELVQIPGLGPKRAHQLFYELGIQNLDELNDALKDNKIRKLKGFGPKSEEKLLKGLQEYQSYQGVILYFQGYKYATAIIDYLKGYQEIKQLTTAGSLRRKKELIGDIDILAVSKQPIEVMNYFTNWSEIKEILLKGQSKTSIITNENLQIDLRVVKPTEFPTALQYFTGSKEHNVHLRELAKKNGYKLNEYGLFKKGQPVKLKDEASIYQHLGLDYIIPELREDRGEIEAAARGELPASVRLKDIKGDLHLHSTYTDGAYSIKEMIETARKLGYQYLAITDHSQSLRVAHGMTPETLKKQINEIDQLQSQYNDIKILKGIEVDIDSEGYLDYSDQLLAKLDLVIASIHTGFNQGREQMTSRIIRAMENPHVNIIAHPRGRILKRRQAYDLDLEKIFTVAAKTDTCLEINASPYRLDLDDISVKKAREIGVKIAINTDSHHIEEFYDMVLGVAVARRGWLEPTDILNTLEIEDLMAFLEK